MSSKSGDTEPANAFALAFEAAAPRSPFLQVMEAMMRQAKCEWPAPEVCFVPLLAPAGDSGVLVHSAVLVEKFEHFRTLLNSGYAESQVRDGVKCNAQIKAPCGSVTLLALAQYFYHQEPERLMNALASAPENYLELFAAADMFELDSVQKATIETLRSVVEVNDGFLLRHILTETACLYDEVAKLFHAHLLSGLHHLQEHELYAAFQAQMLQKSEPAVARCKERLFKALCDGAAGLAGQLCGTVADHVVYERCCPQNCNQVLSVSKTCSSSKKPKIYGKSTSIAAVNLALCKEAPPSWKV